MLRDLTFKLAHPICQLFSCTLIQPGRLSELVRQDYPSGLSLDHYSFRFVVVAVNEVTTYAGIAQDGRGEGDQIGPFASPGGYQKSRVSLSLKPFRYLLGEAVIVGDQPGVVFSW